MCSKFAEYIIEKKYLRKNRLYVRLRKPDGHTQSIPHANYQWLLGNPIFEEIPKGYVVHHLDGDSMNDDISNLVIMAKYHHMAHHLKHKTVEIPILFPIKSERILTYGIPIRKPRVYYQKDRNRWCIKARIREIEGIKQQAIYRLNGNFFHTKKEAENALEKLWGGINWKDTP